MAVDHFSYSAVDRTFEERELVGQAIAWNHSLGAINSFVLKCAVETGIPEVVHGHGRPITLSQLGASLPTPCTNLGVLRRIMRYLVHMQLFTVQNEGSDEREESYGSTSATKFILINEEKSIVPLFKLQMHEKCLAAWHTLGSCMQGKAGMCLPSRECMERACGSMLLSIQISTASSITQWLVGSDQWLWRSVPRVNVFGGHRRRHWPTSSSLLPFSISHFILSRWCTVLK
ncbi:(R,S)-reticuline 7-O-methyltransferase-like [Magnolia sinica]|uniref:(R,S)-reticuline 7-O-methyltransferase-like n=1 Tax=Magnolia sinica TaxID=86752 RepID=UPI00265A66DF|nr:(R,S)-reticuline 7-O-methyltransferase-like [Magnolia sinica]